MSLGLCLQSGFNRETKEPHADNYTLNTNYKSVQGVSQQGKMSSQAVTTGSEKYSVLLFIRVQERVCVYVVGLLD